MARKLDDETRERLIEEVGQYFLDTGDSTRIIAEKFSISNYTVSDYIKRYKKKHPEYIEMIDDLIGFNSPQSIMIVAVRARVVDSASFCLQGFEIKEIANAYGVSPSTIRNDLNVRINKLSPFLTDEEVEKICREVKLTREQIGPEIKKKLRSNSIANIIPNKSNRSCK